MVGQLKKMHISYDKIEKIRSKDGISLYRVKSGSDSFVLKHFENVEFRREIENYLILQKLGIPTIKLIAYTDESILMEDITQSEKYRLAAEADMRDAQIAESLAEWYKKLHDKGKAYVKDKGSDLYMETDCITQENIDFIKKRTQTEHNPVWEEIKKNVPLIRERIANTETTLTYNDFYYTNMVVAKDKSEAFMFDYNLLGKGFVMSDIENVTCQLSDDAKTAFLQAYGKINAEEQLLYNVTGPLVSLYCASQRESFPDWGLEALECVLDSSLLSNLYALRS